MQLPTFPRVGCARCREVQRRVRLAKMCGCENYSLTAAAVWSSLQMCACPCGPKLYLMSGRFVRRWTSTLKLKRSRRSGKPVSAFSTDTQFCPSHHRKECKGPSVTAVHHLAACSRHGEPGIIAVARGWKSVHKCLSRQRWFDRSNTELTSIRRPKGDANYTLKTSVFNFFFHRHGLIVPILRQEFRKF